MGLEYRIIFELKAVDHFRIAMEQFGGTPTAYNPSRFEFGVPDTDDQVSATTLLEPEGIYFLDHGGDRIKTALLFRRIVDEALSYAGTSNTVTITMH